MHMVLLRLSFRFGGKFSERHANRIVRIAERHSQLLAQCRRQSAVMTGNVSGAIQVDRLIRGGGRAEACVTSIGFGQRGVEATIVCWPPTG